MRVRGEQFTGTLQKGQRIHSILYGGRDGLIYHIEGPQDPESCKTVGGVISTGGRANIYIVFDKGTKTVVPECIIRGVQWFIFDEIADDEAIDKALACAEAAEIVRKMELDSKNKRSEEERNSLPAKYPYLIPATNDNKEAKDVLASKNIRIELKKTFPGVKFSVTTKSSVNINWTDGPNKAEVEAIVNKYEYGDFDSMTDSYNYNHDNVFPDVFGGSRYVFANRSLSAELIRKIADDLGYSVELDQYGCIINADNDTVRGIYRKGHKMSCFQQKGEGA